MQVCCKTLSSGLEMTEQNQQLRPLWDALEITSITIPPWREGRELTQLTRSWGGLVHPWDYIRGRLPSDAAVLGSSGGHPSGMAVDELHPMNNSNKFTGSPNGSSVESFFVLLVPSLCGLNRHFFLSLQVLCFERLLLCRIASLVLRV